MLLAEMLFTFHEVYLMTNICMKKEGMVKF